MLKDFFQGEYVLFGKNEKDQYDDEEIDEKSKCMLGMTILEWVACSTRWLVGLVGVDVENDWESG